MTDLRKAAEMALEFVEWLCGDDHSVRPKNKALDVRKALRQALDDKPAVKSYAGGKLNYCTPDVDAVNMTQDRVDETAKGEHDLWIAAACLKSTVEAAIKAGDWKVDGACDPTMDLQYLANCFSSIQNREWVGLTDEEMRALKQKSVDDGMTRIVTDFEYIRSIEAKLKEKNGG